MTKFRKNPEVIEAFQLTYNVAKGEDPMPTWAKELIENGTLKITVSKKANSQFAIIKTLDDKIRVDANDFIIQRVDGDIYPCKLQDFAKAYTAVTG